MTNIDVKQLYRRIRKHLIYDFIYRPIASSHLRNLQNSHKRNAGHSYTQFLRSPLQIETLLEDGLPLVLAQSPKPSLRINVFGASHGAEVYTIATNILNKYKRLDFSILASDIDPLLIQKASNGRYSKREVLDQGLLPEDFTNALFESQADEFYVKPEVRKHCSFSTADILSPSLKQQFANADIVFAQDVLCHLTTDQIPIAFANIVSTFSPFGILLIDGMPVELRAKLTRDHELYPLPKKIREIHNQARSHIPEQWWKYYFGLEPYRFLVRERNRRYGTIFLTKGLFNANLARFQETQMREFADSPSGDMCTSP